MPGAADAEIYFIAAMMVLILVISFVAVFFFVRQYKREMGEKAERLKQKAAAKKAETKATDAVSD